MSTATMPAKKTLSVEKLAQRLRDYCLKSDFEAAQKELYGEDIVSIEPEAMKGYEKETSGKDAVLNKIRQWNETVEKIHAVTVTEPQIAGNSFSFVMEMDITMKDQKRMGMPEICVYTVKDGKVVLEQFFW